jgi:predicted HD superfamily hydrolase involved in NAD metabolism
MPSLAYDDAHAAIAARLTPKALAHCERVAETAAELAVRFGVDPDVARLAGLLHDWGREDGDEGLLAAAERLGVRIHPVDRHVPYLLHAEVSAAELRERFPSLPAEVVDAVSCHTFGRVGMTPLDKVVYAADSVEPGREYAGVETLRALAAEADLHTFFTAVYARSIGTVIERRRPIHPTTAAVWNWIVTEDVA